MTVGWSAAWWTRWRVGAAALAAITVALIAFVFRFNALSGNLGGFDNDHFAHLMRADMLLHDLWPLRDFADAELRGAWPSLSYAVPAWAQQIGGRTLLPEAYLTIGALAVSHAIVFLLALDLSKRWTVAVMAAALAIATAPKLYNYPKVLSLALGVLVVRMVATNPSFIPLVCAAVVTAVATLFRHDYGVYVGAGVLAALLAGGWGQWSATTRRVATYAMCTALFLLPSAIWVHRYEGIPAYVRNALATTDVEMARTELKLTALDLLPPSGDALLAVTYYTFWALVVMAAVVVAVRMRERLVAFPSDQRAIAFGLLAVAILVNVFFLRANLSQRFGDAVVPVVLIAAWTVGVSGAFARRAVRSTLAAVPLILLGSVLVSAWSFGDVSTKLRVGGLSDSWEAAEERFIAVRSELSGLPPDAWSEADGTLVAARYLAECTEPDDHVLVAAYAPEIPVFARRRFAAGQPTVSLSMYTSEDDQRRALERLEQQSVPVILGDARGYDDEFVDDYPLLARYIERAYIRAGTMAVDDDRGYLVFTRADRSPRRVDPYFGLPCFR